MWKLRLIALSAQLEHMHDVFREKLTGRWGEEVGVRPSLPGAVVDPFLEKCQK